MKESELSTSPEMTTQIIQLKQEDLYRDSRECEGKGEQFKEDVDSLWIQIELFLNSKRALLREMEDFREIAEEIVAE